MLYRITYVRVTYPCSVTFSAADTIDAAEFSELWEAVTKLPVLTLKPIGESKFPGKPHQPGYARRPPPGLIAVDKDELTKEEQFQLEIISL